MQRGRRREGRRENGGGRASKRQSNDGTPDSLCAWTQRCDVSYGGKTAVAMLETDVGTDDEELRADGAVGAAACGGMRFCELEGGGFRQPWGVCQDQSAPTAFHVSRASLHVGEHCVAAEHCSCMLECCHEAPAVIYHMCHPTPGHLPRRSSNPPSEDAHAGARVRLIALHVSAWS